MIIHNILNWLLSFCVWGESKETLEDIVEETINDKSDLILEKKYSNIILTSSLLFGLNSISGLYNYIYNDMQFVDVLITNTLLFITSVNYWRKPVYGFRRNIDMATSLFNILYNTYMISHCNNAYICFISIKCILIFYALSWVYHNKNRKDMGVFWHCMVQLAGNIGNGVILAGIVSVPILYNIKKEVSYVESIITSFQFGETELFGLGSFVIYTFIYLTVIYNSNIAKMITPLNYKKSYQQVHELVSYSISTIHASLLFFGGLYFCINYTKNDISTIDKTIAASMGYYISDIIYLLITSSGNYLNIASFLAHHLVTLSCLIYQFNIPDQDYKAYIVYTGARLYLCECTVIPLNYIWYLKNTDNNYKINIKYVTAFEAVFRLFFVFRVINYSELIYRLVNENKIYSRFSIAIIILTMLNYIWFYKIYKIKTGVFKYYLNNKDTYKDTEKEIKQS